ncbi:hypothetical protein LOAG_07440 [Loa loa]|uniref:Uncharacterized protein n=1 Tax=Loa loa TaxID=7209 RepID=A0A1S0TVR3_LOALO|nr:hypothetical protein LOAG_07440 [Loa loa]EFO21049.1 hypothetical protein LOAG_07440 [Loa loa]
MALVSYFTTVADFTIISFLVYLSIVKVKDGLFKYQIRRWARGCLSYGNIWFHTLALYAAIICYLPYVTPIFYAKNFVNKDPSKFTNTNRLGSVLLVLGNYDGNDYFRLFFIAMLLKFSPSPVFLNSTAIGLSTIIALEPYRHAILSILRKQNSSITRVQPSNRMIVGDSIMLQ